MKKKSLISVVVPAYNEEKNLPILYRDLAKELGKLGFPYEIIFIDDGSTDSSLKILKKIGSKDKKVKAISFRKNYGKSAALKLGFKETSGELILSMDADLQDRPDQIHKFLNKFSEGNYDLLCGWRNKRQDCSSKVFASFVFNKVTAVLTKTKLHDMNCGFKLFRKETVKALRIYGELHRYIPVLAQWQGFNVGEVKIKHSPRQIGRSKFGSVRYLSGFFDLLTVMFLTRYISKPLHVFGSMGLLSFFLGGSIIIFFELRKYLFGILIGAGRPIIQIAVFLMIFGVQVFVFGFLAEMIVNIHEQDSQYLIKETVG